MTPSRLTDRIRELTARAIVAERLPADQGWKPTAQETNLTTLMAMAKRIMAATPDTVIPPDNDFFLSH